MPATVAAVFATFAPVLITHCAACLTKAAVPEAMLTTKSFAYINVNAIVSALSAIFAITFPKIAFFSNPNAAITPPDCAINDINSTVFHAPKNPNTAISIPVTTL